MTDEYPQIPTQFRDRVAGFPESSMCVNRIRVTLSDGTKIRDVFIGGDGVIAKVGTKPIHTQGDLDFNPMEIIEVNSEI